TAGRGQTLAIRAVGYAPDIAGDSLDGDGEEFLASLHIPHLHVMSDVVILGVIPDVTGRGQTLAVGAEGHGPATTSLEREQLLAGLGIPYFPPAGGARQEFA